MSQLGTHLGALSNHKAALLVIPSYNNPHDTNWIKMKFLMDEIIKTAHKENS